MQHHGVPGRADPSLEAEIRLLFSPIHKEAFGVAVGGTAALAVAVLTVVHVLLRPAEGPNLGLLSQFFYGYSVSWAGAGIGAWWAGVCGFVMGWFAAFVRNLVISAWLFVVKSRAELSQLSDFLSDI